MLKQTTADKNVYRVSKNVGNKIKSLSEDELAVNVKKLVHKAYTEVGHVNQDDNQQLIIGQKIKHAFREENGDVIWYRGHVISQVYQHVFITGFSLAAFFKGINNPISLFEAWFWF